MLNEQIPVENKNLKVKMLMAHNPVTLQVVPTVDEIIQVLKSYHPQFPVLNASG